MGLYFWGYSGRGVRLTTHVIMPSSAKDKNKWRYTSTPYQPSRRVKEHYLYLFICLFMLYLKPMSQPQIMKLRMLRWSVNNELGHDAVGTGCQLTWITALGICLKETRELRKTPGQPGPGTRFELGFSECDA